MAVGVPCLLGYVTKAASECPIACDILTEFRLTRGRERARGEGERKTGLARKARDEPGLNLDKWFAPVTIAYTGRPHLRQWPIHTACRSRRPCAAQSAAPAATTRSEPAGLLRDSPCSPTSAAPPLCHPGKLPAHSAGTARFQSGHPPQSNKSTRSYNYPYTSDPAIISFMLSMPAPSGDADAISRHHQQTRTQPE